MSPSQSTRQTANVLRDVALERQRQDKKWGPVSRPPLEWLSILAEEFGEVAEKVTKGWVPPESDFDRDGYRTELIQTAAVCASAVECLDYGTAGLGHDEPMKCAFCHGYGDACDPGNGDPSRKVLDWLAPVICPRCSGTGKEPNHG